MSIQFSWDGNLTKTEYIESLLKLRKYLKYLFLVFALGIFFIPQFYHPVLGSIVSPDEQINKMMRNIFLISLIPASFFALLRISLLVRRLNNLGKNGTMYGIAQIIAISILLFLSSKYFLLIINDKTLFALAFIVIGIVSYIQSRLEKICEQGASDDNTLMKESTTNQMTDKEKEEENVAVEKLYQHKRRVRLINAILLFIFVEGFIGLFVLIAGATSGHGDPSSIVLLLAPIILLVLYLRIFNKNKSNQNS